MRNSIISIILLSLIGCCAFTFLTSKEEFSERTNYYTTEKNLPDTITVVVFQTLTDNFGLAREEGDLFVSTPVAVCINDSDLLYDGKKVRCSKELGTYTYMSKDSTVRTIQIFAE